MEQKISSKDSEIEKRGGIIAQKYEEITSLKESLLKSRPIIDPVDLTTDDSELNNNKRPRTDNFSKMSLASILLHDKSQKLVQVKQEKIASFPRECKGRKGGN